MAVSRYDEADHRKSNMKIKSAGVTVEGSSPQQSVDIPKGVQRFDDDANRRANHKVLDGRDNREAQPTDYNDDVPPGVQRFDDNGSKAGGTMYLSEKLKGKGW
jgi:hypothetical protein